MRNQPGSLRRTVAVFGRRYTRPARCQRRRRASFHSAAYRSSSNPPLPEARPAFPAYPIPAQPASPQASCPPSEGEETAGAPQPQGRVEQGGPPLAFLLAPKPVGWVKVGSGPSHQALVDLSPRRAPFRRIRPVGILF